ncbi:MAG: polynucleotide adenylyltransferase PcnB [Gammaproteobacteria bacterium]|nr:polynucleotide adenylyltransferase PcnB [Gammaproteobacteria bacterium]
MIARIWQRLKGTVAVERVERVKEAPVATIIPRSEHGVSRNNISKNALKVLYRLNDAGFRACLVGGGVRDLLLSLKPKDFDIATSASPEEVRALFRNCRLIGRRFRLAHVLYGREVIEVATFRASHRDGEDGRTDAGGRIMRDNVFGDIAEDALRRDFSVNALYYDIKDYSIHDYAGGMADVSARLLRLIGDPVTRYKEDPVRMLRAVRFAAKLDFEIAPEASDPIADLASELGEIPPARLFEEVLKLFHSGHAVKSLELLHDYYLLDYLFPHAAKKLGDDDESTWDLLERGLNNTDQRIRAGKSVTPAFLYAVFLWMDVSERYELWLAKGEAPMVAMQRAGDEALAVQLTHTSLPKRFSFPMREIWMMQGRLLTYTGKRALRLLEQPRFRAGYDFLCLRAELDSSLQERSDWWTRIQELPVEQQEEMARQAPKPDQLRKRKRRRKSPKKPDSEQ